jgi:hypothetical protein
VSGGSGRYAGVSGSGMLSYQNRETGGGSGTHTITWTGALNVPGLTFDTTPPRLTGATSRTVKTRAAGRTRVRYSVSAADATDGSVLVACLPASGTRFRIGRTIVTCKAADGSGNTTTASFVITVKRVRHEANYAEPANVSPGLPLLHESPLRRAFSFLETARAVVPGAR